MRVITLAALSLAVMLAFAGDRLAPAVHAQETAQAQDAETQLWRKAKTCEDFRAYLRAYPQGRYASQATETLANKCLGPSLSVPSDKPSAAAPSSSPDVFGSSSADASAARDEQIREQRRRQMEAERAAAEARTREAAVRQQAEAGKADRPAAKTAKPSAPPSPVSAGPTAAPSLPPPVALPAGYEIVSHVLTPTESYLPRRDGMPTGIVLLDVRERAKNQSLCKALLGARTATVKTEAQARHDNPNGDFLVTNWPVTGPVANEGDCAELLAKYDFDRATRVKGAYALGGSRGPFFLALDPTGEIVFLDLKDASAEEVFKATSDWMKLALAAPQNRPAAEQRLGLVAGTNRLFAELAGGFGSLIGANPAAPALISFNDPVKGTARQFNVYKAGVYLIGATFKL